MRRKMDLIGKRFGRLTVKREAPRRKGQRYFVCECSCDAGTKCTVAMVNLTRGHTKSCGCWQKETARHVLAKNRRARRTHGLSQSSKAYKKWVDAKSRCYSKNNPKFKSYGAKGILMFEGWKNNFSAFYTYMGEPASGRELDRLDNFQGYVPGNVHYSTPEQQQANQIRNAAIFNAARHVPPLAKPIEIEKAMKDFGLSMSPAQTGTCACGRPTYYDDIFCGRLECENNRVESWTPCEVTILEFVGPATRGLELEDLEQIDCASR